VEPTEVGHVLLGSGVLVGAIALCIRQLGAQMPRFAAAAERFAEARRQAAKAKRASAETAASIVSNLSLRLEKSEEKHAQCTADLARLKDELAEKTVLLRRCEEKSVQQDSRLEAMRENVEQLERDISAGGGAYLKTLPRPTKPRHADQTGPFKTARVDPPSKPAHEIRPPKPDPKGKP
jgi:hypothetical protein